jgi:opacity protein-like surface antigen
MLRHTLMAGLLLAAAPFANAADNGFYLGAGYSHSEFGLDNPAQAQPFDDKDNGFKLIAGWRPLDNFGVEVNYIDHGNAVVPPGSCPAVIGVTCTDPAHIGAETLSGFAVGYVDLPLVDLFAKAGLTSWKVDGHAGPGVSFNDDDLDFAWGAGVQARIWSLGARLEYENFSVLDNENIGTVSLSFTYTFL